MEHVERQDEREQELSAEADRLEEQGDELEGEGKRLDGQIDEVREEFERKKDSSEVPGAQEQDWQPTGQPPDDDDDAGDAPRTEEDE